MERGLRLSTVFMRKRLGRFCALGRGGCGDLPGDDCAGFEGNDAQREWNREQSRELRGWGDIP
jgi:hypothetical protein